MTYISTNDEPTNGDDSHSAKWFEQDDIAELHRPVRCQGRNRSINRRYVKHRAEPEALQDQGQTQPSRAMGRHAGRIRNESTGSGRCSSLPARRR